MSKAHYNIFKSKYTLTYVLRRITAEKNKGHTQTVIRAPYASASFADAITANCIECELRDMGYVANLVVPEDGKAYLYISW